MLNTTQTKNHVLQKVGFILYLVCKLRVFDYFWLAVIEHWSNFSSTLYKFFDLFHLLNGIEIWVILELQIFLNVDDYVSKIYVFDLQYILVNFLKLNLTRILTQLKNNQIVNAGVIHLKQILPKNKLNNSLTFLCRCINICVKHPTFLYGRLLNKYLSIVIGKVCQLTKAQCTFIFEVFLVDKSEKWYLLDLLLAITLFCTVKQLPEVVTRKHIQVFEWFVSAVIYLTNILQTLRQNSVLFHDVFAKILEDACVYLVLVFFVVFEF